MRRDLDVGFIYTYEDHWMTPLVRSLAASAPGLRMRFLLVDNASERGVDRWTAEHADTEVIRNDRRLGYAANLNRILERSDARYVLLLNTDMFFDPRAACLTKLAQFMDRHPSVGLSTCRIYRYDDSYAWAPRRYPTLRSSIGRRFERCGFVARAADDIRYSRRDPLSTFACDWFTGCFFFARREAVRRVGPLDEGFVKYYEDVDWCARFNAAGYNVAHYGGTHCFHAEQRASKRIFSADGRRHLRSYARWLWKWRRRPPSAGEFAIPAEPGLTAGVALPHDMMRTMSDASTTLEPRRAAA